VIRDGFGLSRYGQANGPLRLSLWGVGWLPNSCARGAGAATKHLSEERRNGRQ
jgi:hypothetical protein